MQFQYVCTQADVMLTQIKRTLIISSVMIGAVLALPYQHVTLPLIMVVLGIIIHGIGKGALYWQRERDSLSDDDKTRLNWMLKRKHIARHTMLSITSSVMVAFLVFQAINWATWASQ